MISYQPPLNHKQHQHHKRYYLEQQQSHRHNVFHDQMVFISIFNYIVNFIPIEPIICITWIRISIITTEIITSCCILKIDIFCKLNQEYVWISTYIIVHKIRMCIIDTIIHNCCGDIFTCISKCPSFFDVQIKSRFAASLANIFLINLVFNFINKGNILPGTIGIGNKDPLVIDIGEKLL